MLTALVRRRRQRLPAGDVGVTLTELLITIAVLTVVIAPLTGAVILFLRNTDATETRLAESHDMQITAAYFTQDVQSVGVRDWSDVTHSYTTYQKSIERDVAMNQGSYPCGTAPTQAFLRLVWDDPAAQGQTQRTVSYVLDTSTHELRRITCAAGAASYATNVIIGHNVISASIACPNSATECDSITPPGVIKLTLTIQGPRDASSYPVTLVGQRRQT